MKIIGDKAFVKIRVIFFAPFTELFGANEKEIEITGKDTVSSLLNVLCNSRECYEKVFDESGNLGAEIMVLRNGSPIKRLKGLQTKLEAGDEIAIFPIATGG